MRALVLDAPGTPLRAVELPDPVAAPGQLLLRVRACGVCRTDLHIVDGELTRPKLPLVLGHQIVGDVVSRRRPLRARRTRSASRGSAGRAASADSASRAPRTCAIARGSPDTTSTEATPSSRSPTSDSASRSPTAYEDEQAAPLLCAGLIGYRSLRLAGDAERIGLYGFGASAHIVCQVAVSQGRRVYAGTRADDDEAQAFARSSAPSGRATPWPDRRTSSTPSSSSHPWAGWSLQRSGTSARAARSCAPGST